MSSSVGVTIACLLLAAALGGAAAVEAKSIRYEDLVAFFDDWRAFQRPKLTDGVPDYTPAAMAEQQKQLSSFKSRLAGIDRRSWPLSQQIDWHLVRAEMNGLDFDHRVLKPWANNPAFYVTVFTEESDQPAREGPFAYGAVELWSYPFPLSPENAAKIDAGIRTIPKLLAQAKTNLVGSGRDLWIYGAQSIRQQSADLADLSSKVTDAALKADVALAKNATDDFALWVESQIPSKRGPSGIGIDNYDWYLKYVQLVPYTWQQEVAIMERELARAQALLAMEEMRNARLPEQTPIASAEEYDRQFAAAVTEYIAFLRGREILEIRDYMDPALRARVGSYRPGPREFFSEIDYRDPELMRTHGYHWFDKGRMARIPNASPIRRRALLYNIFNTRTEGHATGWEELMMQAGMFDARPRTRELLYILIAERAARAIGELRMHSNDFTLENAAAFAAANTPRGWLSLDGKLVRGEQHLYLQQPGYGTSYLIGKIEIEKLLADRRKELGPGFRMKQFMEEFDAAGLIPASLLRWELSGKLPDDVRRMLP
ncbi:MAG TPA: DUF885 family protein [Thermoanaerobaculia bacterium]